MKNNFFLFFLIFLFSNCLSVAEPFKFEATDIEIADNGNIIYANKGRAFSFDNNLEIEAEKFEYLKKLDLLKAYRNGTALIKSENLKIFFDEMIVDQKNSIIEAKGNVKIYDNKKDLLIETSLVTYNRINNILNSNTKSILTDKSKNIFDVDNFFYEINKDILKVENANFKDIDNNEFNTSIAYINTKTNQLFGKDIKANLNNKSFNKNNEPRLKGLSVVYDNENTEVTKGVFTTCKKTDKCPPWQLSAEKINHDKKNQVINYKNAWLKVYDFPVMYFPKFFHPDPTVKRRSGFLIPTIKNSPTSDNFLNLPYFFAIAENKDATFSPRLYAEDKILLQTEFRQVNKESTHFSDFSFFKEKDENSKSHFFYEFDKNIDIVNFEDTKIDFKVQQTSNDTYLKANRLESILIKDNNILENSFGMNLYSDQLTIDSEVTVYEDLNKSESDRFEYILPRFDFTKKIDNKTKLLGDFSFRSNNMIRNYNTNILEKININDLLFNSSPKISKKGFYNNYNVIVKNANTDTQNSKNYKDNENYFMSGLFQFNSSLPLIKESEGFQNILKPKLALKLAPNSSNDVSHKDSRIDVNNVYSLNRIGAKETIEGGASLTFGNDYTIIDKENSKEIFGFRVANNVRLEENHDLPRNNQIGQKTSNLFGEIAYSPNDFLTTKYNTSMKNNFNEIDYENLTTEFRINNFVTTFDYLNENNSKDKNSYLSNTTKYEIDDNNNFIFATRENKTSNLTEYYNLIYQYKNDCLAASIEYNKDYYSDRDVKPEESVFLKLTIIPFGQTNSPNLKN
jgi:LPS-assembly protein